MEYFNTGLKNFMLSNRLLNPPTNHTWYSTGINHATYSPTCISSDHILYGDRPFAAPISCSLNASATQYEKKQRLSTSFSIGIMGPAALGNQIQTVIYQLLKKNSPHGWQYQAKNDIVIHYDVNYQKKWLEAGSHFLMNGIATASLGTLADKISGGFNFMAGNFIPLMN